MFDIFITLRFLGEGDKEMHQNEKPTCTACKTIVFLTKYQICGAFGRVVVVTYSLRSLLAIKAPSC